MFFFTTKSTEKNRTEDTKVLENSALFVWFFSVFSVVKYALDVFFYHKVHGEKPHGGHKNLIKLRVLCVVFLSVLRGKMRA